MATNAPDRLDDYVDVAATALGLTLEDAWRPAVRANLELSLKMARMVDAFALPDDIEPATIYSA